jgi:hypothetical protein
VLSSSWKKGGKETAPAKNIRAVHSEQTSLPSMVAVPVTTDDPRSWTLSLSRTEKDADTSHRPAEELKDFLQSGAAPEPTQTHALQQTQIAFSVAIPKEVTGHGASGEHAGTAGAPKPLPAGATQSTSLANTAKENVSVSKPETKDAHAGRDRSDSETSEHGAAAPTPKVKDPAADDARLQASFQKHSTETSGTIPSDTPPHVTLADTRQASRELTAAPTAQATQAPDDLRPPVMAKPQSIDLRLGDKGAEQVDIRVSQRAGDVQVTVRTADGDLAQSLRHHLPELSERLSQEGMTGNFWQPSPTSSTSTHTDSGGQDSSLPNESYPGRQDAGAGGGSARDGEDKRYAAWFEEMNNPEGSN